MNSHDPTNPIKILAVDDEQASRAFIELSLASQGFQVLSAKSGKSALRSVLRHRPDMILLDVMMPDMDGFSVCRSIKSNPATADTPVIFLSGIQDPTEKVEAFHAGAIDYLTKPVAASELCARIHTHLSNNRKWRLVEERSRAALLLLQEVFDAIDDAVFISRALRDENEQPADFQVEYANQKFSELIGIEISDLIGLRHSDGKLFLGNPRLADCIQKLTLQSALHASSLEEEVYSPERNSWHRISIFALRNNLTAIFIRDIYIYKNLEAERLAHQEAMFRSQKMATLGTLVAGVSHEINNPNNVLSMNIPMLEKVWKEIEPILWERVSDAKLDKIVGMPA